ncbi:glyoxalase/bleomycin resistance protein/dioxygenase [Gloeothece citriformis PCC 7424]|uniref:Glyoxalase/bleomycin resistance protein/dioxygenase n=1 Tax=Gloeothece citriformis (strain PCC 7424) TaxID=65393 RepID=B7K918_GLOC7|nr:glyoxalase/bleomycin resistance/dioxygenase family protein [Gloeothece citriformis]ACK72787.1 glyoxalase/bleomycin resistance protein/dioxygenase [Gloeothece citriformis PCC 7424]
MALNYHDVFVTLGAIEFDRLVEFYSTLFAQNPEPFIPNVYAEFKLSGLRLGIFSPKKSHQLEFSDSAKSGMSLCFEVENLDVAIALLKDLGYPPPGDITIASHGREIYAYDPAGNRLILHQSNFN